ncbi:hypothetical protein BSI_17430 [Bacillus inaquosorum KCTC 13429]|uniref:Uncharacterized protein n=1 Tax=Bacillus inaquosorum KCTC 13429 TaxID=1236548 RepID=A0A9W5LIL3_9BACI|nr:hypothetical protein BSI_17430 [Bacillus inaquosorum KCTC 13429]
MTFHLFIPFCGSISFALYYTKEEKKELSITVKQPILFLSDKQEKEDDLTHPL